jgi:hypothetical protein
MPHKCRVPKVGLSCVFIVLLSLNRLE